MKCVGMTADGAGRMRTRDTAPSNWLWRAAGVLFAPPMLSLQLTYPGRRRKVSGEHPPPTRLAVFVVLGSAATLAMPCYVLASVRYGAAVYINALTIDFFTVVFGLMIALDILMQQPSEASERPAPR